MLVLRRKLGEVIRIGTGVTVRVLEFRGNQVHLGLEAPPEVKIFREEVYRAMVREGEANDDQAPARLAAAQPLD